MSVDDVQQTARDATNREALNRCVYALSKQYDDISYFNERIVACIQSLSAAVIHP
jgi:hypothetical protein